jgi:hypothetical protein
MEYEPKFWTTGRISDRALWVSMPDGSALNIWDLPEEALTMDVQSAIKSAFERGMIAQQRLVQGTMQVQYIKVGTAFERKP